jgi:hypothetical protein
MIRNNLFISIALISLSFGLFAKEFDGDKVINDVHCRSKKKKSIRSYLGQKKKTYNVTLDAAKVAVLDFSSRCNNELKDRRVHTPKDFNCKYPNKNMVETVVIRNLKTTPKSSEKEIDRFVMARYIYNRNYFHHNELATVELYKNDKNKQVIKIHHAMLDDAVAASILDNPVRKNSAFISATGTFYLTELEKNKVEIDYHYESTTDHWLLNKSVAISEFFESMASGINELYAALDGELDRKTDDKPVNK